MKHVFKKFTDLKPDDVNFDFHIHTNQTDGDSTPEEIIKKAMKLKLKAIAFTEHVNIDSYWFDDFATKITNFKNNKKIRVLLGIEVKALDFNGELDATQKMIDKSDIVIGVVHRYPGKNMDTLLKAEAAEIEFKLAMGLLKNKDVTVLGHPFGVYSRLFGEYPEDYLKLLMMESLKNKIAIEINTKYMIHMDAFFRLMKKINPYVSIGSDAHRAEDLARSYNLIHANVF